MRIGNLIGSIENFQALVFGGLCLKLHGYNLGC